MTGGRRGVALLTGAYQARSVIASAQRCVNLYLESNPKGSVFPTTHYLMPGITPFGGLANVSSAWRGLWAASNGDFFGVNGNTVYAVAAGGACTALGTLQTTAANVSMNDNGTTLMIVDGTAGGVTVDLATHAFSAITDPAWLGSSRVDFVDGYFILNQPKSTQWYISLYQEAVFDALDFASKNGAADLLVGCIVNRRNIWLFGQDTAEVWYNTGASDFTFQRMDGIFLQHGCAAVGSLQQMDGSVYFVTRDPQGDACIMRTEG